MHPKLSEILSKYDTIIFVGWGTGWHIQPIVSIVKSFQDSNSLTFQHSNLLWIWGRSSEEEKVAGENNIPFKSISTLKLSTTKSPKVLLYPFVLIRWILEARKILISKIPILQPSNSQVAVFSKGWPGSVAIGIAAWTLGIPLYIHESDTIPGRSSRILGKVATRVFLGFEIAKRYFKREKCEVIGQILHSGFSKKHSKTPRLQDSISWNTTQPHILVICGSQWARSIFEEILRNLESILEWRELIIVLGKLNTDMRKDFESRFKESNTPTLQILDWISQEDLATLIPDTDIAITRGSATTLAELTAFRSDKIPRFQRSNTPILIIIPLPYSADNHQYWNAKEYEKTGDILLDQNNLNQLPEILKELCYKITNKSKLSYQS